MLSVTKKYLVLDSSENLFDYYVANHSASGYVTFETYRDSRRLGNQMFMFAALFYVANATKREVVLFSDHSAKELETFFSLGVRKIRRSCPCFSFHEHLASYDVRIEAAIRSENATNSRTILLHGFFQSWKYFQPVEHQIRAAMKFKNDTEAFARDILSKSIPEGWTEGRFIRVGIHNRRGDFTLNGMHSSGYTTAPATYFQKAMKYFVERHKLVQFIVVSDDTEWSQQHITYDSQSSSVNVTYSLNNSAGQDMAILSLCDHVIISTGTFGWLAAWYGNGNAIYYSNYPGKGSNLAKKYNASDYYPPHWIPMD